MTIEPLLSKAQVAAIVGLHPSSVMRLARAGSFPQPLRTGDIGSAVRFRASDVSNWIERRAAAPNVSGNAAEGVSPCRRPQAATERFESSAQESRP